MSTPMSLISLALSTVACAVSVATYLTTPENEGLAVVDAQAVLEAKKLELLTRLRHGEKNPEAIAASVEAAQKLPETLQAALTKLASDYHVTIVSRQTLLAGRDVIDLTDDLYRAMETSPEAAKTSEALLRKEAFQ